MFGTNSGKEIPKELLEDHTAWDHYVGDVWAGVLAPEGFQADATVIEIAPGSSVKIGSALRRLGFAGKLFVVDPVPKVIAALRPKYAALLPKADITFVSATFADSIGHLPAAADFLLASHMIDDMMLARFEQGEAVADWAAAYTHTPSLALGSTWARLSADPAHLAEIKAAVGKSVRDCIAALRPASFAFNQYPSSVLYDNGLASLNDHAFDVFCGIENTQDYIPLQKDTLQKRLDAHENYGNAHIGEHVLNNRYWMLCKRA